MTFEIPAFSPAKPLGYLMPWLGVLLVWVALPARAELTVLASIKPMALIAQEVTGERARVDTLLPASASPHDYPLRVSDVRRLRDADVVLWVGPELESFLQRSLRNISSEKQLKARDISGISWPHLPRERDFGSQSHQHLHGRDPHLWLNPLNAVLVARTLAERLGASDPAGAEIYRANAERFTAEMAVLDEHLMVELKPIQDRGFAVYHEGYAHFVARYNLRQVAHVTFSPERRPGARHMYQLRQQLQANADCLFTEPYYDMQMALDLAGEFNLRLGVLDPLGSEQVASYQQLLVNLARSLSACLAVE